MRIRRTTKLMVEPPASSIGDIVFNLIVFFLACVSVQPDTGRRQTLPRSEETSEDNTDKHVEVAMTRTSVSVNGEIVRATELPELLRRLLEGKPREEDRVVVVKSRKETPYHHWIQVTTMIQDAGGIVTIQTEEERAVEVDADGRVTG